MTTLERPASTLHRPDLTRLLLVPALAGLVLGVGDLVWMDHVAYPWAGLANSTAVWAVAAFALGAVLRTDPVRAALAGVVMMLTAVEAYYGWAAHTDQGALSVMWSPTAQMWLVFGVVAGAVFGVAGAWTNSVGGQVWWQHVVGSALGAGVLLGEALHTVLGLDGVDGRLDGGFRTEQLQTAAALAALGVVVLVLTCRRPGLLLTAVVAAVPVAGFSAAAFSALGMAS